MAGFVFAMAVVPATASGAPGVAPATTTAGALKLVKNVPAPWLLLRVVLLAKRISPPNLYECVPFVQLNVSPYVQSGLLSVAVAVMLLPAAFPPKQFPGGRAPVIGLQTPIPPEISGRTRKPLTFWGR